MNYKDKSEYLKICDSLLGEKDKKAIAKKVGYSMHHVRRVMRGDLWDQYGVAEATRDHLGGIINNLQTTIRGLKRIQKVL